MSRKNYIKDNIEELVMLALILLFTSAGIFNLMKSTYFLKETIINEPHLPEYYLNITI